MGEKLTRTQIKNLERFGGVNPADEIVLAATVCRSGRRLYACGRRSDRRGPLASRPLGNGRGEAPAAGAAQGLFGQTAGQPAEHDYRSLEPGASGESHVQGRRD